jgi:hypothetical protein
VAVDISGRHLVAGRYLMVCAAVSASISPECMDRVYFVRLMQRQAQVLDLKTVTDLIQAAAQGLAGVVIAEPGDLFNLEAWRVESILGRAFKYPETLGERASLQLAHHISIAGRRLICDGREVGLDE